MARVLPILISSFSFFVFLVCVGFSYRIGALASFEICASLSSTVWSVNR